MCQTRVARRGQGRRQTRRRYRRTLHISVRRPPLSVLASGAHATAALRIGVRRPRACLLSVLASDIYATSDSIFGARRPHPSVLVSDIRAPVVHPAGVRRSDKVECVWHGGEDAVAERMSERQGRRQMCQTRVCLARWRGAVSGTDAGEAWREDVLHRVAGQARVSDVAIRRRASGTAWGCARRGR
jgi:hypothetical protein